MIMEEYDITKEELDHLENLPTPMGEIPDSIYRVAFDPIRKLSRGDRLTGAAQRCLKHGLPYDCLLYTSLLKGGKCKKILSKNLLQNLPLAIVDVWKYNQYNGIIDKRLSDMNH